MKSPSLWAPSRYYLEISKNYISPHALCGISKGLGTAIAIAVFFIQLSRVAAAWGASAPAMITPGHFNVSASGAFTYSVPIAVPPGTGGMAPALSLEYSSQGHDGTLGLGWSVSGLPSIIRCPRTQAQDAVHGGVNYALTDRFCMAGQRLVLTSGTYGAANSQYRTEVESFSKIVAYGTAGNGPAYFKGWTKSGQIMEFGNTADSQVLAVGKTTARIWEVNKISDTKGNYLTVSYNSATGSDRTTNGEAYPVEIDYTGNASSVPALSPYASVKFVYSTRTDQIPTYQAGSLSKLTVLLTNVETFVGSTLVANYKLGYTLATSGAQHDELTSITQCDSLTGGTCLASTTFGWQGSRDTLNMTAVPNGLLQGTASALGQLIPTSWNGDGLTDIQGFLGANCPTFVGTASAGFTSISLKASYTQWYQDDMGHWHSHYITGPFCGNSFDYPVPWNRPFDYNGDGFTDALLNQQISSLTWYNFGLQNVGTTTLLETSESIGRRPVLFGDFNGDGRSDFVTTDNPQKVYLAPYPLNSTTTIPVTTILVTSEDFDGDGCTDFLEQGSPLAIVYSCNPAVASYTVPNWSGYQIVTGDFNGDGKEDILVAKSGAGTLYLSTGTGLATQSFSVPTDWGKYQIITGDWNQDGKTDIALISAGNTGGYGVGQSHSIWLSTGTGFVQKLTISNTNSADTKETGIAADWNSDGADDIWLKKPSGDTEYLFSYVPEMITSVTNGLGITTTVTYDRLNKNGTFYKKCNNGTYYCGDAYPTLDLDGPFYAVSRIDSSNGLGTCAPPIPANCYSSTYGYVAATADLSGRGFQGFQQVIVTDLQTNIVQTKTYRLDFPFTGLIASETKTLGSVMLSSISNVYEEVSLGTGLDTVARWFVGIHQSISSSNDYDGTTTYAMPTLTTSYVYDCDTGTPSICSGTSPTGFGNATQITSAETYSSDNATKVTTNTFDNDATNWLLGRLRTANVQSTVNTMPVLTRHTSFTYDAASGLLTSEIIEPGASDPTLTLETDYGYDAFGNKSTSTGKGCVWVTTPTLQCTVDAVGNPTSVRTTTSAFDQTTYHGSFPTTITNAKSQNESWGYDTRFGEPTSHTGPNGLVTSWSYDTFGRKTLETRPDGNKTAIAYTYCTGLPVGESCPAGAQFDVIVTPQNASGSQNGPISISYYDGLSRLVAADVEGFDGPGTSCTLAAPCWIRTATQYDLDGRVSQTSRPYFLSGGTPKWTINTYDQLSRIIQKLFPDSSTATFAYQGLTSSVTNDKAQTITTLKNAQGQNASVTANGKTTTYTYDAFGNQLTVTDPAAPTPNITTTIYDLRGRKLSMADPDMGTWTYVYDGFGELYKQTDAKTQITTLTYDALGRVLSRTEVGLASTWTYDTASGKGVGQLASATTGSTYSRTFTYDTLGRPSTTQLTLDGTASTYTTTYDANGHIASVTYPSGLVLLYAYTPTGYLCRIADNAGSPTCASAGGSQVFWTANVRDAEMHLTQAIAGNGVLTNQVFDPNTGLIQTIQSGPTGNPTSVANFAYGFDTLGNLTSRQDVIEGYTERFCYDALNRLTNYALGATCTSAGTKTVGYDDLGNITSKSDVGTYTYSKVGAGPHAVTSITGVVNGVTNPVYTYDTNGNQICEYASSGGNCTTSAARLIVWTSFNMAAQITQGATVINLSYDTEHARYKQVIGGSTTYYLNDPASSGMSEKLISGATTTWHDYIVADGKIIAQRTAVVGGATSFNYFVLDHLGSIAVITDGSGAVVTNGRLSYDAWGRRRNPDGTDPPSCIASSAITTRGFTNQEEMDGICAVNLNARIYDPTIGKFLSPDPIIGTDFDLQLLNRYSYVRNNPLSLTDESGLFFGIDDLIEAVIVLAIEVGVAELTKGVPIIGDILTIAAGLTCGPACAAQEAAVNAGVQSGKVGIALKAFVLTYAEAVAFQAAGDIDAPVTDPVEHIATEFITHGIVGGTFSVLQGGNFKSGFLAGGISSLADEFQFTNDPVANTVEHAVVGGLASVAGGGKFANGAVTGAFGYLFNELQHSGGLTAQCQGGNLGACTQAVGRAYGGSPMGAALGQFEGGTIAIGLGGAAAAIGEVGDALYGAFRAAGNWLFDDEVVEGATSRITNVTSKGAQYQNFEVDMTQAQFENNLTSNGYSVTGSGTSMNGPYTILSNGQKTYTVYTGTSTAAPSVDVQVGGQTVSKLRLQP